MLRTTRVRVSVVLAVLLLPGLQAGAATIRVSPGDSIQAAIDRAVSGDLIVVAPGTYTEHIRFKGKAIKIGSQAPKDPATVAATVISGAGSRGSVVTFNSGEGPASILSGLTITGGRAWSGGGIYCSHAGPTIINNRIIGNTSDGDDPWQAGACGGGGVYCYASAVTLAYNTISDNRAYAWGGGVLCAGGSGNLTANTITLNTAEDTEDYRGSGGGVCCAEGSTATLAGNTVQDNWCSQAGGGIYCDGSSPAITRNLITSNHADDAGGGVCASGGSPTISDCTIRRNDTFTYEDMTEYGGNGGGVACYEGAGPLLIRDLISGNRAILVPESCGGCGGGVYCDNDSTAELVNCTVVGNSACEGGGTYGAAQCTSTIIAFNPFGSAVWGGDCHYCCLYGNDEWDADWAGMHGNISADPLFVDAASGAYHLRSEAGHWAPHPGAWVIDPVTSPCIDAGDPAAPYSSEPAPNGERLNMGAYGGTPTASKSPPELDPPTSVTISPAKPTTADVLVGHAEGSAGPAGKQLVYVFQWAVREPGEDWSAWGAEQATQPARATSKGQSWKVRARAAIRKHVSDWAESAPVVIHNSLPQPPTVVAVRPRLPQPGDTLRAYAAGGSDADEEDQLSYVFDWSCSIDGGSTWDEWGRDGRALAETTVAGQCWKVRARSRAGGICSEWVESAAVTVGGAGAQGPLVVTAAALSRPAGTVEIFVQLSAAAEVEGRVLNLAGREVAALPLQSLNRGPGTLLWKGRSAGGPRVPPGRYLLHLQFTTADGARAQVLTPLVR